MALEFKRRSRFGETAILVLRNGQRLGGIYRAPDGSFRFYLDEQEKRGSPTLVDHDLEHLKAKIEALCS